MYFLKRKIDTIKRKYNIYKKELSMIKDYYLGLDMGTNSVGWAATDAEYNLIRKSGKDLWGVREFDEAETSAERRTHRVNRRRLQREQARVGLLKGFFADAIKKVDPNFYQRLENSKYFQEDKDAEVNGPNGIFDDKNYRDADYYKQYPTIFHLRKELIQNANAPYDPRLVFLAILNMYRHRGHFLNVGLSGDGNEITIEEAYSSLLNAVQDYFGLSLPEGKAKDFEKVLSDKNLSRTGKYEKLAEICSTQKTDKIKAAILKCICGLKVDAKQIFTEFESEEKVEIEFSRYTEESSLILNEKLGDDYFEFIEIMHQIYDLGSLANILKGETYLSYARVEEYAKHHKDIQVLKALYRKYKTKDEYDEMFRSDTKGTYSAYVNSYNTEKYNINGKPVRRNMKERSRDDLYKTIKSALKNIKDKDVDYVLGEIDREAFLLKQLTAGNGVIPNQVHARELKAILKNASKYLAFLNEKDESGLTVAEKISTIFSFHIPYYIGPVSEKSEVNGGNGWVIRKEKGMVLPWNIEEKIDIVKTSQRFIERLVNNCTYMSGEKVLPKGSLLFEKYCVLNEINNIKIDGERISVELKQKLYNELFLTGKKVTRSKIEKFFVSEGVIKEKEQLSGIDNQINNSLSSYGKLVDILGDDIKTDKGKKLAEDIIYLATVYGDARKMLKDSLKKKYGDILSENQIKRISGLRFKDWGSLSKEFLEMKAWNKNTGEEVSLIGELWDSNNNMMELINSPDYTFKEVLQEKQTKLTKVLSDFTVEDLQEYYFSAPVKRMIWQTLGIIKELEKILGCAPKRIFIEMTRTDEEKGDKGRRDSRAKTLLELYKNLKDESRDWKKEIEEADKDGKLKIKKLYLYYIQNGRCMYTGEPIDLDDLFNDNLYDIDHIYPRHYVKDDNLGNNMVLVKKTCNAYKSDDYPLPAMKPDVYELWKRLFRTGFINEEKYKRLTGKQPFTDEQKAGFIARQLVETGQGTKGVADLLKQLLPDTTIVYSKGRNVSDFRNQYKLIKSRIVNDFHHAQDAYLNIVVGNVYYVKFTQDPLNYMRKLEKEKKAFSYHLGKMFEKNITRGDETAWVASDKNGESGTIVTVKKVMARNTPMITRLNFEGHGQLTEATMVSAREANYDNYIPLKQNAKMADVKKYGGFTSAKVAYYFLVEFKEKGKIVKSIEAVPLYYVNEIGNGKKSLMDYCEEVLHLENPRICLRKIKIQSLLKINGFWYHLSSKTGDQINLRNAVSLCFKQNWINYIHDIEKYCSSKVMSKTINKEDNYQLYCLLVDKHRNGIFKNRQNSIGDKINTSKDVFIELSVEEQCDVIEEILKLSNLGLTSADLRLIGGSKTSGTMKINKKIQKMTECKLINQSITGFYENEIDLLKL